MLKVRDNFRMNMYQHRRERLLSLIDAEYGGERVRFCDKTGLSESRLAQLLSTTYRDGTAFTEKTARKVEAAADLPMMYFDQGAVPLDPAEVLRAAGAVPLRSVEPGDASVTQIAKVRLKVQAGITGFQVDPEHYDGETIGVRTSWVVKDGLHPASLFALVVKGESMEPSLHDGDTIVMNARDTNLVDGQVYVVNYEGEVVVKRLVRDAGQWWLASDNADQRKYHKKQCKSAECIILGKVVRKESTVI
jgi:hypothetical protein